MSLPKDEEETLDALAYRAHDTACEHGFFDGFNEVQDALRSNGEELGGRNFTDAADRQRREHTLRHVLSLHALIHTEVGEITEAVRKPRTAEHIGKVPAYKDKVTNRGRTIRWKVPFTQEEEETADVLIRLLDYAAFRGLRLGAATMAKMKYNAGRPYMHGKKA